MSNLTKQEVKALRESHSPWAEAGQGYQHSLIIAWHPRTNKMSIHEGRGAFVLSDWAGHLCSTEDKELLTALVHLESSSRGALRELITGEVQEPEPVPFEISLESLEIEL